MRKDERGCCHLLHTESKKHEGPVALRDTYTQIGPTGRPVVIARDAQLHHLKSLLQVSEQSWETPPHSFKLQLGHLLKQAPWALEPALQGPWKPLGEVTGRLQPKGSTRISQEESVHCKHAMAIFLKAYFASGTETPKSLPQWNLKPGIGADGI